MSKISDNIDNAKAKAKEGLDQARQRAGETSAAAKIRAEEALQASKDAAAKSVETSKELAHKAVEKSEETIEKVPLAVVAGGVALGALFGALLPKSKTESKYLGKAGKAINETAKKAATSAKDAGLEQIDNLGVNKDAAKSQFQDLISKAGDALKTAGDAAADSLKSKDK